MISNSHQTQLQNTFQTTFSAPEFVPTFTPSSFQTVQNQHSFVQGGQQNTFNTHVCAFKPTMSMNSNVKEFTPSMVPQKTPLQSMTTPSMSVMASQFTPGCYEFQAQPQVHSHDHSCCYDQIDGALGQSQDKVRYQALRKNGIPTNFNAINADRYKTQRCRRFHQLKWCEFGGICSFRHEFRTFKKVHKYFYVTHLYRLKYISSHLMAKDVQESSRYIVYKNDSEISEEVPTKGMSTYEQQSTGLRPRLSVFQAITQETLDAEEKLNQSIQSDEQLDSQNTTIDDTLSSNKSNKQSDEDLSSNMNDEEDTSSENELVNIAKNILDSC